VTIQEKLVIKNFFSIKEFEWDIRGFNILTGGMASGKSLALKLLYFCEQIFHRTIFNEPNLTKDKLGEDKFFDTVRDIFYQLFPSKNREIDFGNTIIKYEYTLSPDNNTLYPDGTLFPSFIAKCDLSAKWSKECNNFKWSSDYITGSLGKWQKLFDVPKTLDLADIVKTNINSSILADFHSTFPFASMFIPASRAIAAIVENVASRDHFISKFMEFKNFALSFDNISNDIVNKILRVKNITTTDKNEPEFELPDDRKITALELSSGQQELLYLLLLINDLKNTVFRYGGPISVFIEEPCAHLFPKEQKETMEFLVDHFHLLQNKKDYGPGYRFFISTHSPYVLDTINNILEKRRLLTKAEKIKKTDQKNEIIKKINALSFPDLAIENVSAYMINNDGQVMSMINAEEEGYYIYSAVIESIANIISVDADKLFDINQDIVEHL